jgi:RNA polymerase sigma-70 factor (ECF subfamily)
MEDPLVQGVRSGDPAAFETLIRQQTPRLLAVARRILKTEDDAREAVHQGFISAFKSRAQFEGHSQLSTWLHRIVVNKALDMIRARQRRPEDSIEDLLPRFLPNGSHNQRFITWPSNAEEAIDRERTGAIVHEAIDELPESFRLVLQLRDIEELSTEEAAQAIGISPNAVKLRLHRARLALRTLLSERFQLQGAAS